MAELVLEKNALVATASEPHATEKASAAEIKRRLEMLDELEAFFAPLTQDTPPLRDDAVARSYSDEGASA